MRITISGPIGSGKSTVGKLVAEKLKFTFFSGGEIFRMSARKAGLSLEEFGRRAETDPSIDREQDRIQVEIISQHSDIVFESRLAGWLASENKIDAVKIYLDASLEERVRRVSSREGGKYEGEAGAINRREESELKRYNSYYGVNFKEWGGYDLKIDTTEMSPVEASNRIVSFAQRGR
ncbi:MAG: cytidylate kinase family protein [Candidatus Thermoplasmatota archaeon]|jgi:cytidylate kinase|nr:cytidylate kinase family protein [Candidatus Thermoplasmatota archaeon]MCL5786229.1 cytidylate kinase family protein [Candidatus Thermoplasmatota archaeon]